MTATLTHRPLPELLGRRDGQTYGEWVVDNCPPTRGLPVTSVEGRIMCAPMGDDPLSRAIRAHEMVHAKVSPMANDMEKWVARGRATKDALIACEELRVNYLATQAGFDMSVLTDGSEEATGERCVALNLWDDAVRFAIGTAGTGAHKKFISGVRRHNRTWATVLADIAKRAMRDVKRADYLADTSEYNGIQPIGFAFTETLAEWIDRLCEAPPKEKEPESSEDKRDDRASDDEPKKRGRKPVSEDAKDEAESAVAESRKVKPADCDTDEALVDWFPLRVEKCPMPAVLSGSMGKKRVASVTGKSPRRLHRMLTDPERRVFDRVVRGKGGVVVVDASGSMRITASDVKRIVESAPGATVIAYTARNFKMKDGVPDEPNCWVLSHKGRMIEEMPFNRGAGNGVDLPALRYGMTYRHRSSTPFVWVSDAQVTGYGDRFTEALLIDTLRYVVKNDIVVTPNVESAITALGKISKGERVKSVIDPYIKTIWRKTTGLSL